MLHQIQISSQAWHSRDSLDSRDPPASPALPAESHPGKTPSKLLLKLCFGTRSLLRLLWGGISAAPINIPSSIQPSSGKGTNKLLSNQGGNPPAANTRRFPGLVSPLGYSWCSNYSFSSAQGTNFIRNSMPPREESWARLWGGNSELNTPKMRHRRHLPARRGMQTHSNEHFGGLGDIFGLG